MFSFDKLTRVILRSSLLWGTIATVGFYMAVQNAEPWVSPVVLQLVSGRWEAYACVAMFFVGLSAMVVKAVDIGQNWFYFQRLSLGPAPTADASIAQVKALIKSLDGQPKLSQATYLTRRLRDAFEFVLRSGGQESLDGHLRYLADIDAGRMNTSYGVPRFLCWAIPAMGSLGAVMAIGAAVGQLSLPTPQPAVAATTPDVLSGVATGLAAAFETMALAIGLSVALMLLKFAGEHAEGQLLDAVEARVEREVTERCGGLLTMRGSQSDQMRYVAERLGELTEKLAQWQSAAPAGGGTGTASGEQIEAIVSRAMAKASTGQHQITLAGGGQLTDMSQVQDALKQIAAFFSIQQAEHQQESEIVKQLSEIIHESETSQWKSRKEKDSVGGSLAGLWNALSD